jgi:HlyD family secretion protein
MNAVWTWIRPHIGQLLWGLLFLFLGAAALRWWAGPQVQTEAVQRRDLLQTVVASGRVETPHRVDMGAQITGTVARVPVAEGQAVQAGDVLIELASNELQSAQRQAEQAVMQAKGRLRQLNDLQGPVVQQTLRQAQANLDAARANGQRSLALFEQGFIGQAALDESHKALTLAEAQVLAAQKQVASTQAGGAEHSLAMGAVAEAQANAEGVRAKARYAVIKAPVSGQLIGRSVEVGDVVQAGKVLMTLSPEGATQLVVQIDEKNLRLMAHCIAAFMFQGSVQSYGGSSIPESAGQLAQEQASRFNRGDVEHGTPENVQVAPGFSPRGSSADVPQRTRADSTMDAFFKEVSEIKDLLEQIKMQQIQLKVLCGAQFNP